MNILSRLIWWRGETDGGLAPDGGERCAKPKVAELPAESYVFECRVCGKVFEARRRRPSCPECDASDVALMSE